MQIGRNDPCPCGSGKKYKKCCMKLDGLSPAAGAVAGQVRRRAAGAAAWQADVVPLPGTLRDEPASRLATLLIVADGFVVHNEALNRPSPEPEEMADDLLTGLLAAGERVGNLPGRLLVRDPEVAAALTRRLEETALVRPPAVEAAALELLDEVGFFLAEQATGQPGRFYIASTQTWAGWGLPEETVAAIFRAAAAYYRAAPWRVMSDIDAIEAVMPTGQTWTVCVLGNDGQEFGLNLFSSAEDLWRMTLTSEETAFDDLEGRIVSLTFDAPRNLRPLRREVAAAGWEVAGPAAYPHLFTINTPAGGLRRRDAGDLLALLAAVPRFAERHAEAIEKTEPVEDWRDEETGTVLSYQPEEDDEGFWPSLLTPGNAQGPGADPEAAVAAVWRAAEAPDAVLDRELAVVERFAHHLATAAGFAESTVEKHAGNAASFIEFVAGTGVPLAAVHEYDLRVFLFDWYPRKVSNSASRAASMPVSLERFFDFLAAEEGIVCPWARPILGDREAIARRWADAPGGAWWDLGVADWRGEHDAFLEALVMLPDSGLGDEEEVWGPMMGFDEARLQAELSRRWLLWRDELLADGVELWHELAEQLISRQRRWEQTPHPHLEGRSPLEAVLQEREARGEDGDTELLDVFRGLGEGSRR